MTYTSLYGLGPERTPAIIRHLIFVTCAICLFSALTEILFRQIFGVPGLQYWLALSWSGFKHYYLWQLVSYMFVLNAQSAGINLYLLLGLTFNMYIVWVMGSPLAFRVGSPSFLRFYFLSGLFAALIALLLMKSTHQFEILSGPSPTILALLTVWTMFNPEAELLLFFALPFRAKWLLAGILGAIFLICLSQWDFVNLFFNLSGAFFGYLYGIIAWELQGPYHLTQPLDRWILALGMKLRKGGKKASEWGRRAGNKTKIYDFKTGEPILTDDQFVDAMLSKISKSGESSLTYNERRRMQQISEKKRLSK